jgi:predicted GNAT family acetyltransferase
MTNDNFTHDAKQQQFRLKMGGQFALVDYVIREGRWYLLHSEVPYELRGQGVGKLLVEQTFEYIEANHISAVALCTYIKLVAQRSAKWRTIIG